MRLLIIGFALVAGVLGGCHMSAKLTEEQNRFVKSEAAQGISTEEDATAKIGIREKYANHSPMSEADFATLMSMFGKKSSDPVVRDHEIFSEFRSSHKSLNSNQKQSVIVKAKEIVSASKIDQSNPVNDESLRISSGLRLIETLGSSSDSAFVAKYRDSPNAGVRETAKGAFASLNNRKGR